MRKLIPHGNYVKEVISGNVNWEDPQRGARKKQVLLLHQTPVMEVGPHIYYPFVRDIPWMMQRRSILRCNGVIQTLTFGRKQLEPVEAHGSILPNAIILLVKEGQMFSSCPIQKSTKKK